MGRLGSGVAGDPVSGSSHVGNAGHPTDDELADALVGLLRHILETVEHPQRREWTQPNPTWTWFETHA